MQAAGRIAVVADTAAAQGAVAGGTAEAVAAAAGNAAAGEGADTDAPAAGCADTAAALAEASCLTGPLGGQYILNHKCPEVAVQTRGTKPS